MRSALTIFVMAVSFLLSVQFAGAAVNQVQHGLSIDHAGAAFSAQFEPGDSAHHTDEHVVQADHADADGADRGGDAHPGPHHHHPDGGQIAGLVAPMLYEEALSSTAVRFLSPSVEAPLGLNTKFERPPRALLETQA